MDITDVRIRKMQDAGKMLACASVTFDNEFIVHDVKIIDGATGLFVAMPNRKTPAGEFKDVCHPVRQEVRDRIQEAVLQKYEAECLNDEMR